MSDAFTDLARDQRRFDAYRKYLKCLVSHIEHSSDESYKDLKESANAVDSIKAGYWGKQTNISDSIDEQLSKIKVKDEKTIKELAEILEKTYIPYSKEIFLKP